MRVRTGKQNENCNKGENLGVAIWRTILNIKLLCFPRCVPELLLSHLPQFIEYYMHSNGTIKNASWPHFSWPTLYVQYHFSRSLCVSVLYDIW